MTEVVWLVEMKDDNLVKYVKWDAIEKGSNVMRQSWKVTFTFTGPTLLPPRFLLFFKKEVTEIKDFSGLTECELKTLSAEARIVRAKRCG